MKVRYDEVDTIKSNFFHSAYSEAYQDAFLSWIFLNYNSNQDNQLRKFSKYFIEILLNDQNSESAIVLNDTKKIKLERQVHKSDISMIVDTNQGKHLIIIEDKVGSAIHSSNKKNSKNEKYKTQLIKYVDLFFQDEKYVEFFMENKVHLFVYKNQFIDAVESKQIKVSDDNCIGCISDTLEKKTKSKKIKNKAKYEHRKTNLKNVDINWIEFGIERIYDVFDDYVSKSQDNEGILNNLIINEYFQMIKLWNGIYREFYDNTPIEYNKSTFRYFWHEGSWLWEVFFYRLTEELFGNDKLINDGSNNGRVKIATAERGFYWVWSMHSTNHRYVINIGARDINTAVKKSKNGIVPITVSINLPNPKYGDDDVWGLVDGNGKLILSHINDRVDYANKLLGIISENYSKDRCPINPWGKAENVEKKLNNSVAKITFELHEISVREVAKIIKEVMGFAEEKFPEN